MSDFYPFLGDGSVAVGSVAVGSVVLPPGGSATPASYSWTPRCEPQVRGVIATKGEGAQEKKTECRQRGGCNVVRGIVAPSACANCGASDDPGPDGAKLKPCSVCKTAKYCGRGCQAHFRSTLFMTHALCPSL